MRSHAEHGNEGDLTGWRHNGPGEGLNPYWRDPVRQTGPSSPFHDNAIVPDGLQILLIQNTGFEKGKSYRVTYSENSRRQNAPTRNPSLVVTLGGETIVSEHVIESVETPSSFTLPFNFVESALFVAPRDGNFELKFEATVSNAVTVFIDDVRLEEIVPTHATASWALYE